MQPGRASRTAEHNALFRALESARPRSRRLLSDPLAAAFLGRPFALVVRAAAVPGLREGILAFIDRRWPGIRTSVIARTRVLPDRPSARVAGPGSDERGRVRPPSRASARWR